jgi:hypothetical protein
MSETQLSYRFWGIPHSNMLSVYIHLNEQLKSSGYRDAKGMGEGNGKTVINPLASRCVECGRLIQAGSLCKTCTDSKKLSEENRELKAQMEATQKDLAVVKKVLESYNFMSDLVANAEINVKSNAGKSALELIEKDSGKKRLEPDSEIVEPESEE